VANKNQEASIAGAVAAAHYIRSIAPSKTRSNVFAALEVSVFEMSHKSVSSSFNFEDSRCDNFHPGSMLIFL
jgi:hypothetical protein